MQFRQLSFKNKQFGLFKRQIIIRVAVTTIDDIGLFLSWSNKSDEIDDHDSCNRILMDGRGSIAYTRHSFQDNFNQTAKIVQNWVKTRIDKKLSL